MRTFGWVVLATVFLVELAVVAAYGVWGWSHSPRWVLVWLLPVVAATAWGLFAAPRARFGRGSAWVAPAVKVVVIGGAVLALDDAGHPVAASVLLVVAVAAHALAQLPAVRTLADPDRG